MYLLSYDNTVLQISQMPLNDRDGHQILKLMAPFFNERIMIGEFMAQRLKGISSLLHF